MRAMNTPAFPAALHDELHRGLTALVLDADALAPPLLVYLALLDRWNHTYNLTAIRDPRDMVTRHLLDSLAMHPFVERGTLADLGTGPGLPGIPLAIARPELSISMVDTVQKKATFLQQAAIQLGLNNVVAHHARVEQMTGQYAQISSRAFAELKLFTDLTRHLLAPGGRWLAMKGMRPEAEIAALPADIIVEQIIPLHVPGLDAERHLIFLKAGS